MLAMINIAYDLTYAANHIITVACWAAVISASLTSRRLMDFRTFCRLYSCCALAYLNRYDVDRSSCTHDERRHQSSGDNVGELHDCKLQFAEAVEMSDINLFQILLDIR